MAKAITEGVVDEIKARIDLAELIARYGIEVKSAGSSKKACCPFHHEKTPSFNINESKGFYHCFGCGESGDAIKFVQKMEGLSFVEAVKKLAEQCGIKIEEREDPELGRRKRLFALLSEVAQFYHRCLNQTREATLARDYLKSRELPEAVQSDYLIGYAPKGVANILKWAEKHKYTAAELADAGIIKAADPSRPGDRGYHRFGGRLMFSIRDRQGRVVGFSGRQLEESKNSGKYVNSPETAVFKKSNILYGFDRAMGAIAKDRNHEAIVCEGQIDCIRLQTSGFANAVAGQGTAFTAEHVHMLKRVSDQVTLVYDDDGAGHKATIKSARLCLGAELPVRVVSLPGGDDPDSFLRTHPADEFRQMLENAESIMNFQVRVERAKERNPDSVDAVSRIVRELLTTIAACPGAVLRASMTGEVAKLTGLPVMALNEELAKVKSEPVRMPPPLPEAEDEPEEASSAEPSPAAAAETAAATASGKGEDASRAIPPPPREQALAEFLMANEYAAEVKTLDAMVGEFLPAKVISHPFVQSFVETWRAEVVKGEDLIGPWSDALAAADRTLFDRVLSGQSKLVESSLPPVEVMQDFIRALWIDALKRRRGELPAVGDLESEKLRMRLTMDIKRLAQVRWNQVKEIIRSWTESPS